MSLGHNDYKMPIISEVNENIEYADQSQSRDERLVSPSPPAYMCSSEVSSPEPVAFDLIRDTRSNLNIMREMNASKSTEGEPEPTYNQKTALDLQGLINK